MPPNLRSRLRADIHPTYACLICKKTTTTVHAHWYSKDQNGTPVVPTSEGEKT